MNVYYLDQGRGSIYYYHGRHEFWNIAGGPQKLINIIFWFHLHPPEENKEWKLCKGARDTSLGLLPTCLLVMEFSFYALLFSNLRNENSDVGRKCSRGRQVTHPWVRWLKCWRSRFYSPRDVWANVLFFAFKSKNKLPWFSPLLKVQETPRTTEKLFARKRHRSLLHNKCFVGLFWHKIVVKNWSFCSNLSHTFGCSSSFDRVVTIHCQAAPDLGAGVEVEEPFDCLIIQNSQAVQSKRRSMEWTLEDKMVDGLFFCAPHSQSADQAIPHLCKCKQQQTRPIQTRGGGQAVMPCCCIDRNQWPELCWTSVTEWLTGQEP